jgi:hypothetical protein
MALLLILQISFNLVLACMLWAELNLVFLLPGNWDSGRVWFAVSVVAIGFVATTISGILSLYRQDHLISLPEVFRTSSFTVWWVSSVAFALIVLFSACAYSFQAG